MAFIKTLLLTSLKTLISSFIEAFSSYFYIILFCDMTILNPIKNEDVWKLLPWDIQIEILSRLSIKDLCELQSVCKDWQSIIESPRFHMLQINANLNQNAIIMHSMHKDRKSQIQTLNSNEIYEFDVPIVGLNYTTWILATSNGLVLMFVHKNKSNTQLLVFNPITKECIELPKLPKLPNSYSYLICDFFEHDLESSTYKIFLAWKSSVYIYNSSFQTWQSLAFISNLTSNRPFSCVTYKNNIYVATSTLEYKWVMVVYSPVHDAWNKFDTNIERKDDNGRLIIANDHLFYAQDDFNITIRNSTISIFEMKIEDKLLIPIIQISYPSKKPYYLWTSRPNYIFGFGNKITIMKYKKDVGITYDVCTHEQEEFRNNIAINCKYCDVLYPFKCTLVSPKRKQT